MRILLEQAPGAPMNIEFPRSTLCLTIALGVITLIVIVMNRKGK